MHLLSQIADGNTLSRSELSRRLKISNELLEQMLLDLCGSATSSPSMTRVPRYE